MKDFDPQEILDNAIVAGKEIESSNEQVAKLVELLEKFQNTKQMSAYTGKQLTELMMRISTYLFEVGRLADMYNTDYNSKYIYRKLQKSSSYNKLRQDIDSRVGDAKEDAELAVAKEYKEELQAQYLNDRMHTFYEDCNRLIYVLGKRVDYLNNEMKYLNAGQK